MTRSVKIYRVHTDTPIGSIRDALSAHRPTTPCVEIAGTKHIPKIRVGDEPSGDHLYASVRIPTEVESSGGAVIDHTTYQLYVGTNPSMVVIQTGQKPPYAILRSALDGTAAVEEYEVDKSMMVRVADAIRARGGNIVHDPRFEFEGGAGYEGLSRSGFTLTRSQCATTRLKYGDMLEKATIFEPVMRVFQAEGICEGRIDAGRLLKINRNFAFSMYIDVSFERWVVFLQKCVHSALKGG